LIDTIIQTAIGLVILAGILIFMMKLDEWHKRQQKKKEEEEEEEKHKKRRKRRRKS